MSQYLLTTELLKLSHSQKWDDAKLEWDVLGIGDKFVSKHDFNQHLIRFELLEQKVKAK